MSAVNTDPPPWLDFILKAICILCPPIPLLALLYLAWAYQPAKDYRGVDEGER